MSRKFRPLAGAVGVLALVAVASFAVKGGPDGATSPELAVSGYVAAVKADDRDGLANLADPDHDSNTEITNRLRRYGGRLAVTGVSIGSTESDSAKPADLAGTVDGAPYHERLWLYRHDDRWFVALGPDKNAHPKRT